MLWTTIPRKEGGVAKSRKTNATFWRRSNNRCKAEEMAKSLNHMNKRTAAGVQVEKVDSNEKHIGGYASHVGGHARRTNIMHVGRHAGRSRSNMHVSGCTRRNMTRAS